MTATQKQLKEHISEIIKCGKDPIHFINTYVQIQHPNRGRIDFKTYDFQDDVIRDLQEHRFNIVMKSRQLGLSTVSAAYALWLALFYKDKSILVIATKLDTAINFIKKIKTAIQGLPSWLVLPKWDSNKRSVTFDNGSQITAIPTSEDAGRSEALSLLIVDEAAFIRDFDDLWGALYPTISTGGKALLISTPAGVGGQYYKLWVEAEAGVNDFHPIKLPWYVHPEHDEAWFIKETKNLPKRKISQEFLCEFETSGDTFLQVDIMSALYEEIKQPIQKLDPSIGGTPQTIWIWKHPEPEKKYVITADVARGDSADFSTFHVVNVDDCDVVAEYMGKCPPEKLAILINEWGKKYNTALACPENNSFGYFTCVALRDGGYPKMYYMHRKGNQFDYNVPDYDKLPGFSTQGNTRPQILTKLEELLRNKLLKTHSQRLFDQLQSFVWQGVKAQAMKESHDDLIMSLAIAAWLIGGSTTAPMTSANAMALAILKATSVNHSAALPGGIDQVKPVQNPKYMGLTPGQVYRPRDASQVDPMRKGIDDMSWLLK